MSFYRNALAALVAAFLVTPVFAADMNSGSATDNAAVTTTQSATDNNPNGTAAPAELTAAKININTATTKQLMKVKGLNASKARAIIAYRKKHGNFKSVDELAKVKGFSKMKADTFQEIQNQVIAQ